jgi:hypothetical protein
MTSSATRRRLIIVVPTAIIVLGVAGWSWRQSENPPANTAVTKTGESGHPDCGPVLRESTRGAGAHIDDAPITYAASPPAFGDHSSRWEVRAHSFYTVEERPDIPVLVHNLEHGYNILWYDQTVIDDAEALDRVREIAEAYATLDRERDPATAFIAAPWTTADGDAFPDGMDYALTHWYADPTDRSSSRADELGLTQYCADVSAVVVDEWMNDYPLRHAPEGYPDLM